MSPVVLFTVVATVGGFLITAAGAVATWAALRTNRQAATLTYLKDAADAAGRLAEVRKSEIADQAQRIEALQRSSAEKDLEIATLQGRVDQLTDMVTGRPAFDTLTASFALITQKMDSRIAESLAQVDQIRAEIRAVREAVEANANALARREPPRGSTRRAG